MRTGAGIPKLEHMDTLTTHPADSVEALGDRIATLVLERQTLRAASADHDALEENRLELVRLQKELSLAFGRQHQARAA
jgi:hypothetical protein